MNKIVYIAILALLGGIIIHVATVIAVPHILNHKTAAYFTSSFYEGKFKILSNDNFIKKVNDPLFDIAVCSFDLQKGPVRIYSDYNTKFWSLSVYDQNGLNRASANSASMEENKLDIVLSEVLQASYLKQNEKFARVQTLDFDKSLKRGFVILRSFARSAVDKERSIKFLNTAECVDALSTSHF